MSASQTANFWFRNEIKRFQAQDKLKCKPSYYFDENWNSVYIRCIWKICSHTPVSSVSCGHNFGLVYFKFDNLWLKQTSYKWIRYTVCCWLHVQTGRDNWRARGPVTFCRCRFGWTGGFLRRMDMWEQLEMWPPLIIADDNYIFLFAPPRVLIPDHFVKTSCIRPDQNMYHISVHMWHVFVTIRFAVATRIISWHVSFVMQVMFGEL